MEKLKKLEEVCQPNERDRYRYDFYNSTGSIFGRAHLCLTEALGTGGTFHLIPVSEALKDAVGTKQ
jgi:hypothetical protein